MNDQYHIPVFKKEAIEFLVTKKDGIYVDATLGGGGHSEAILQKLDSNSKLFCFDLDASAIEAATLRLSSHYTNVLFIRRNFSELKKSLLENGVTSINGILFDLGVSSYQLDEPSKGFSFRSNDILDMRMDQRQSLDARTVLNTYDEHRLADIFFKYGEEKMSRRIAKAIVHRRAAGNINTTGELSAVVEKVVGGRFVTKSLARIFQAIRIEVNNELDSLSSALSEAIDILAFGGRIVVISYHSLEDRIVKEIFRKESGKLEDTRNPFSREPSSGRLKIMTKKIVVPTDEEIQNNPRARSAKMRAAEKL